MSDVFSTLPISEKENGSKLYLFVRDKFYADAVEVLGQEVTDDLERIAGMPGAAVRTAQWKDYFAAATDKRDQLEAFYNRFRRAHRGTYEQNGVLRAYKLDDNGDVIER